MQNLTSMWNNLGSSAVSVGDKYTRTKQIPLQMKVRFFRSRRRALDPMGNPSKKVSTGQIGTLYSRWWNIDNCAFIFRGWKVLAEICPSVSGPDNDRTIFPTSLCRS